MSYHERHIKVTFQDQTTQYFPGKATPRFARECRKTLGYGPAAMWQSLFQGSFEVDQAATLLWAARWQTAELAGSLEGAPTLADIEASIDADGAMNEFTIEFAGFVTEAEPEATPTPDVVDVTVMGDDGQLEVPADPEA